MGGIDTMNLILNAVRAFVDANTGFFAGEGQAVFNEAAIIVLAWFGAEWSMAGWPADEGLGRLFSLFIPLSIGYTMVYYYVTPIPGVGMSFPGIITREAEYLAQHIGYREISVITERCTWLYSILEVPGITDVAGIIAYVVIVIMLLACITLAMVVISYGLIAEAVMMIVGPIFIPFFIVPRLDWLFWNWLKCFLQFAFYQVIAAAVIFILGNILVPAFAQLPPQMPIEAAIIYMPTVAIMLVAEIYAILKIPHLTNHLFSGASGGGLGGVVVSGAAYMIPR